MSKVNKRRNLAQALACGTAMVLVTMMAPPVMAQDATPVAGAGDDAVIVIGTRKSQQTAIDRKKKAKTATDSIVAEDVGVFPDRNIGEAISRIAGVALDRGDFNEGTSVTLRGNSSSQTNVEIDGLGVQTNTITGGLSFGSDGRGKSFNEFPADLIKSVDVVKGSTAAMTEGGLGGSILVQSRNGLDFKKPYLSFRYAYTKNSLSNDWTPDFNLIASRKFFGNRLGVLLNFTQTRVQNDQNNIQPQTSGSQGLARVIDFDNSPQKTFTYQPNTVSTTDPASTTVFANSTAFADGTTKTPLSLITKSAGAATKADCYSAFPVIAGNTAASLQRGQELVTCLNQWNDYTPSLIRYGAKRDDEQRRTIDLRFDFKVNDDLTVFAKINKNKRTIDNSGLTYTLGNLGTNPTTVSTPTYNGRGYVDTTTGTIGRSAIAGSGYYLYPGISLGSVTPTGTNNSSTVVNGIVANIDPTSVVVDAAHHVTKFSISDGTVNTDQIHNTNAFESTYLSAGGTYQHGNFKAEFLLGDSTSDYTRYDRRTNFAYTYGPATVQIVPQSGLWTYATPSMIDFTNPNLYTIARAPTVAVAAVAAGANAGFSQVATPAYSIAQQPWTSGNIGLSWSPRENETHEQTAKLDLHYNVEDRLPFFTKFQAGLNSRNSEQKGWGGGGQTIQSENTNKGTTLWGTAGYVGPIATPRQTFRGSVRACDDTRYGASGTAAPTGALTCNFGYVPVNNIGQSQEGVMTLTQSDLASIIGQSFEPAWYQFMSGLPDRGNLFNGWSQINVDKFYDLVSAASKNPKYATGGDPLANYNFDCLKVCKGNDGKMYAQPVSIANEKTFAYYFMSEFEQKLPLDMTFDGNIGARIVHTDVDGSGTFTVNSIRKSAGWVATAPNNNITTISSSKIVSFTGSSTDWMPSFNANLWVIDNKLVLRYYYARVVARPSLAQLLPIGTCIFDERVDYASGTDYSCSGTIGNPSLKAFRSKNMNWSLEWYPNKDTQFSLATFRNKVTSGSTITAGGNGALLAGLGLVDPGSGASADNIDFNYSTYKNGPGQIRRGIEFATKTAFTFLPWYFKYTGFDGNYAKLESSDSITIRDLLTGASLPPTNESSYYYNASLWYDDGATNVRLAVQARDKFFRGIAPEGTANTINNYPADGVTARPIPYNIGSPNFQAATKYIDFKMSHKFEAGFEYFFEAKNVLKESIERNQDTYNTYSDGTPVILDFGYPGYRVTTGIIIRR